MITATMCPTPPADFASRTLPIREINLSATDLYRIHRREYGPIYYTRKSNGTQYRFDAANAEFGVLYVALSFEGAFMETVIRDRFHGTPLPLLIDEEDLTSRAVSRLGWSETRLLRVADFTKPLVAAGGDGLILSTPDYNITNKWSSAVYCHPGNVDGILYRSRYSGQECIAIFERAAFIARDHPVSLIEHPELSALLDTYEIGIASVNGLNWLD